MKRKGFAIFHETRSISTSTSEGEKLVNASAESTLNSSSASDRMLLEVKHTKVRTPIVAGLIAAGGALLFLSILINSIIPTFMGLGLILWGFLLLYVTQSRYVPDEIVSAIPLSLMKSIDSLVSSYGCNGRTIFLHPKTLKGMEQGYVFIPAQDEEKVPSNDKLLEEKIVQDDPKGILLPSPSQSLATFFEKKLNANFATTSLAYIQEKIPPLLVDTLRIADDISLEENPDNKVITIRIRGGPWIDVCRLVSTETRIGNHLGCPMCGAFALILSKVNAKPTRIKQTTTSDNMIETAYQSIDTN